MAIPSFFKQNKPRGFNYIPRYYDPVKEELEQRRRELARERAAKQAASAETTTENKSSSAETAEDAARQPYRTKIMRGDMKNYFPRRHEKIRKQSSIRLVVILIIIALLIYIYLRF